MNNFIAYIYFKMDYLELKFMSLTTNKLYEYHRYLEQKIIFDEATTNSKML